MLLGFLMSLFLLGSSVVSDLLLAVCIRLLVVLFLPRLMTRGVGLLMGALLFYKLSASRFLVLHCACLCFTVSYSSVPAVRWFCVLGVELPSG